jgi:putative nucleotidyltransferase with HDIG domain
MRPDTAPRLQTPEEVLKQIGSLPPFHAVASQMLRLSSSSAEDLEIDEVAAIIDGDQAFAAELLQMANSPLFGLQYTVRSSRHAIVVLGLERTKALAVRIAMQIYLKEALDHPVMQRCWLHSLACAEIAKTMAGSSGKAATESAQTAGLLHDIGRVALLNLYRDEYLPLLDEKYESAEEIPLREAQAFGFDHCRAGSKLCDLWNFPREIGEVALGHHEPMSGQSNQLLDIVRISCRMADSLGFMSVRHERRPSYDQIQWSLPPQIRQRFQFSAAQLHQMIADRAGRVPQ